MSELSERLRKRFGGHVPEGDGWGWEWETDPLAREAADALDSLTRERDELKRQVEAEISDMVMVAGEVSKVYDELTRGRISKPNTVASAVIAEHDETCYFKEERDELAATVERLHGVLSDLMECVDEEPSWWHEDCGHVAAARAALAGSDTEAAPYLGTVSGYQTEEAGKAERHQAHYRTCGCLGDSDRCCDPSCCATEEADDA